MLIKKKFNKHKNFLISLLFAGLLALLVNLNPVQLSNVSARTQTGVVRAVLFYSPTCPHCEAVIQHDLPPLQQKYGERLEIKSIDVTQEKGFAVFRTAQKKFGLQRGFVPMLVVGNVALVGSDDIPAKFPELIERTLAEGGTDWPDIPGLAELIAAPTPTPQPELVTSIPQSILDKALANVAKDPAGNALALFVLAGMLIALLGAAVVFVLFPGAELKGLLKWVIPFLCIIGLSVAGYLSYVETTATAAVCGPVGNCNSVQSSEYTKLFGLLPIGVVGLIGYVLILAAWTLTSRGSGKPAHWSAVVMLGLTVSGTLYSTYLTFLEPFVIGASCIWCLSSAVLMTLLMLCSVGPGKLALGKIRDKK